MTEAAEAPDDETPIADRSGHDAQAGVEQLLQSDLARRRFPSSRSIRNLDVDRPSFKQFAALVGEGCV